MLKKLSVSVLIGLSFIFLGYSLANLKYMYQPELRVSFHELPKETQRQITCLADNIYFEAAYEPDKGKKAVAFVTLNRVYSGFYPDSICEVVKQRTRHVCQFSWYCEERPRRLSYTKNLTTAQELLYNDIRDTAIYVYLNYERLDDPTNGALFYHADYVSPGWRNMIHTATIGRHIFYIRKDML
jgi:spore germination cell wall hydrolase CwlJ-like protein